MTHDLMKYLDLYRRTLLEDVMPFWERYAIDSENGGINNCISDDGQIQSRDRWNWSQWRAVWVFSKLYSCVEPRPQWLEIARGIYTFVSKHDPLPDGHWSLLLDGEGKVQRGYESIYVDGFAIYGLVELYRATGDALILEQALRTFRAVKKALADDAPSPPAWPYPIPEGWMAHGISMLFSLVFHELALECGDAEVIAERDRHHERVMNLFLQKDSGLVYEWLTREGRELPPPEGTAIVPGHAIESMWFQIHIAEARNDPSTIQRAVEAIRRHLEIGWDEEWGGLFLAVDAQGAEPIGWQFPDSKVWWPHTEALYATLVAYQHCGECWCLDWHRRIQDYAFTHFPVPEHGEWRQKLDRRGEPNRNPVGLPVKDPFHLPRALYYCIEILSKGSGLS